MLVLTEGTELSALCAALLTKGSLQQGFASHCDGLTVAREAAETTVRRDFCAACGSTMTVSVTVEGKERCRMLAAGVLQDRRFPRGFLPQLEELCKDMLAPFAPVARLRRRSLKGPSAGFPVVPSSPSSPAGRCTCGACQFRVGEPLTELHHCHCSMCRQMSGSDYQTWTPVRRSFLIWEKRSALREIQTSKWGTRTICLTCGAALGIVYKGQGLVWLAAGSFDDNSFGPQLAAIQRQVHICTGSAPPWNLPERWPADGLQRCKEAWGEQESEGEEDEEGDHGRKLLLALWNNHQVPQAAADSDEENKQVEEALRRSLGGAEAAPAVAVGAEEPDPELEEALRLSLSAETVKSSVVAGGSASSSSPTKVPVGELSASAVASLQDLVGCTEAEARAALVAADYDPNAAAEALLLKAAEPCTGTSVSSRDPAPAPCEETTPPPKPRQEKVAAETGVSADVLTPQRPPNPSSRTSDQPQHAAKRARTSWGSVKLRSTEQPIMLADDA